MSEEGKTNKKQTVDSFAEMFKSFGEAIGEVFDDPGTATISVHDYFY